MVSSSSPAGASAPPASSASAPSPTISTSCDSSAGMLMRTSGSAIAIGDT